MTEALEAEALELTPLDEGQRAAASLVVVHQARDKYDLADLSDPRPRDRSSYARQRLHRHGRLHAGERRLPRFIEATVSADNKAIVMVLRKVAKRYSADVHTQILFPGEHHDEVLYRIEPLAPLTP
ncbi:hypothetical protein ACFXPM_19205 [Streptomyces sp. NPDC059095]|uniref:hypothetical protein n=1 Tax=Streptomyces sp. NPDC059095 TaxID=3346726 RepID=UPI0036972126